MMHLEVWLVDLILIHIYIQLVILKEQSINMFSQPFYIHFNSYKRINQTEPNNTCLFSFRPNKAYSHMALVNYSIPKVLLID